MDNEKKMIEFDCECDTCKGTGLYVGMAERCGAAVVCHYCKGTGKQHRVVKWREFAGRKPHADVVRVYSCNPGIGIGEDESKDLTLPDFGGIPYEDWQAGRAFPLGSEMRRFTCPCQWYQMADSSRKPEWRECEYGSFFECSHFASKELCWQRFDMEQNQRTTGGTNEQ